jgi:catechol 2,3-dioxygenase-like lactoylglutathione lyase family enzyme
LSLPAPARFNQVAISVSDRSRSLAFYRDLFGLTHVGGTRFSGRKTEEVQGMAGASSHCSWLMDDRPHFQFEIFEFDCPRGRAYAANRSPQDTGYSRLIFSVPALGGIAEATGSTITRFHGKSTLLFRDDDGILVQVIEEPVPRARLAGVALSVPDMATARRSFVDGCGCQPVPGIAPDWGALWGENAADKDMALLDGGTISLELSCYRQPAGKPWPDGYRLADHGILNVALGFESTAGIKRRLDQMIACGFVPNAPLVTGPGLFALTYSNDPHGFNVETLHVSRLAAGAFGFRKANLFDRGLMALMQKAAG